ncbi:unnamed protein product [Paramecium pentaurelia]|uniref:Tetratricopeptide repeat protein n=1 Tax=Paramecium pentaurelia TaxID=43138 RepID=A0A8S1RVU5_9CILI|nr:unnamed protein product [Paramecium pentaurelia]
MQPQNNQNPQQMIPPIQQNSPPNQQITPPIQQINRDQLEELLQRGRDYLKSLEYKNSIQSFGEVLKLEPINIQAKVGLMNALQEMNYFNSSLLFQRKIFEQDPQNFDALLNQGLILYNYKKYSESIEYIQQKLRDNQFDGEQEKKLLKLLSKPQCYQRQQFYRE